MKKTESMKSFDDDNKQIKDVKKEDLSKYYDDNVWEELSATGANPMIPPMSEKAQENHDHHIEPDGCFPGMSMAEYVRRGVSLARKPVDDDILGYRGEDGCIVRFNKKTEEWVKAYIRGVASYMIPTRGINYYLDRMEEDGGVIND